MHRKLKALPILLSVVFLMGGYSNYSFSSDSFEDQTREFYTTPNIPFKLCAVITQNTFLEYFENTGCIGGGGEAIVYSVENRKTKDTYALVLNREMRTLAEPDYRLDFIQAMIKNQKTNPHQGKIHSYFWIENRNYPFFDSHKKGVFPTEDVEEGRLLNETYANDTKAIQYRHEAIFSLPDIFFSLRINRHFWG